MSRWFRLYAEVLNDPKVQRIPAEDFRSWVNLLCLASENDGKIPRVSDVSFALRMSEDGVLTLLERLSNGGLIDRMSGGPDGWHYAPHAWAKRQYKSDTSTERVKRFRERSATVSETPPETEAETEQNTPTNVGVAKQAKRGSRIDPDWKPSDADLTFAQSQNMTHEETRREADKFRDFWIAKPGAAGVKLDWSATWRNWCRNRRGEGSGTSGQPNAPRNGPKPTSMAGILAERRRQAEGANDVPADRWILREG